jgi:hypothetical protein
MDGIGHPRKTPIPDVYSRRLAGGSRRAGGPSVPRHRYAASTRSSPSNGDAPLINLRHTSTVIDQLRAAAVALGHGDPEPFASLFAEGAEWRGRPRGHLWWKHTPS